MMIQKIPVKLNHSKVLLSLNQKHYVLPSVNTTPLYNKQKTSSNKEDNPKTNKFTQDIEAEIQQAKTHKNKYNTNDND